jgi:tripartite-type tricarboxylate transporter receptor subunit TctC
MKHRSAVAALFGAVAALAPMHAQAADALACRRVEIIVPYEAGGGTDLYARFLAPIISRSCRAIPPLL